MHCVPCTNSLSPVSFSSQVHNAPKIQHNDKLFRSRVVPPSIICLLVIRVHFQIMFNMLFVRLKTHGGRSSTLYYRVAQKLLTNYH